MNPWDNPLRAVVLPALLLVVIIVSLVGCGGDDEIDRDYSPSNRGTPVTKLHANDGYDIGSTFVVFVERPNGTKIECVVYDEEGYEGGGGVSCDWVGVKRTATR